MRSPRTRRNGTLSRMASSPRSPFGRPFAGRRRRAFAAALLVSGAAHGVLAWWILPRLGAVAVVPETRPPMTVVIVPREVIERPFLASPRPAASGVKAPPARAAAAASPGAATPLPAPTKTNAPAAVAVAEPSEPAGPGATDLAVVVSQRRERAIAEAIAPTGERLGPWRGATGTPGGPRSPTDSIDGRPRLGSGEAGDPRIPGSGNVDIARVVERDGVVAQAQERARQGQVHPFLGAVKDRVEECWLPVAADADSVTRYVAVEDGVCAKGFHLRHNVGRVYAIYDPKGTRVAIELDTGHDGAAATLLRHLRDRVQRAFDEAGMRDVPPELLDEDGLLRVAWNVFIDDYRQCDTFGEGANAHKPGGDEIIGIVELDGVY